MFITNNQCSFLNKSLCLNIISPLQTMQITFHVSCWSFNNSGKMRSIEIFEIISTPIKLIVQILVRRHNPGLRVSHVKQVLWNCGLVYLIGNFKYYRGPFLRYSSFVRHKYLKRKREYKNNKQIQWQRPLKSKTVKRFP